LSVKQESMTAASASSRRYPLTLLITTALVLFFFAQFAVEGFASLTMSTATPKYKLYDMPVSNHGARCRLILYKVSDPRPYSTREENAEIFIDQF
jgi:hypothetical protein